MKPSPERMPQPKDYGPPPPPEPHGGYLALGMRTWEATEASDPLDGLDPDTLRLLWYDARAELLRTLPAATCALIRRGRCVQVVVARMRAMVQERG